MQNNNYFYSNNDNNFTFYRIPKQLFITPPYKNLPNDAKLLYTLMLDRMCMSVQNNWTDEKKRVYIYFTVDDIRLKMNCGAQKAVKMLTCLEKSGLIQREKHGQGRPTVIYVKKISDTSIEDPVENFETESDGTSKSETNPETNDTFMHSSKECSTKNQINSPRVNAVNASSKNTTNTSRVNSINTSSENTMNCLTENLMNTPSNNTTENPVENYVDKCVENNEKTDFVCYENTLELRKSKNKDFENQNSRLMKIKILDFPKSKSNNNKNNKNKNNNNKVNKTNNPLSPVCPIGYCRPTQSDTDSKIRHILDSIEKSVVCIEKSDVCKNNFTCIKDRLWGS